MSNAVTVSNSRLNLFDKCHYAHYLKYALSLEKRVKATPFVRGSMFHSVLEDYNNGKSWKKKLAKEKKEFDKKFFQAEKEQMGDLPGMVHDLMLSYQEYYEDEELEYIWSEAEFVLPLTTGINLQGFIDALAKEGDKLWPMDHKTYKTMPDRDDLLLNPQSNRYMWALTQMDYIPAGFIWNIIKAKRPSRPEITKSGKLSQKAIDSTPTIVKLGLQELGLNYKDYPELMKKVSFESFFYRKKIRFNKTIMDNIMRETILKADRAVNHLDSFKDKSLSSYNCKGCQYKDLCYGELLGQDTDYIISKQYQTRKKEERNNANKDKQVKVEKRGPRAGKKESYRRKNERSS